MSERGKNFTASEKYKIALEAIKGEQTLSVLSSKYQVHVNQILSWRKKALDYLALGFSNKLKIQAQQEEEKLAKLAELYKQIGQLKVENDFLKKKSELFKR